MPGDSSSCDALAQRCTRPLQSLVDRFLTLEEPERDLLYAEPAEDLQREDDLGFARDSRIGADEEHPELIIPDLVLEVDRFLCAGVSGHLLGVVDGGVGASLAPERTEHLVEGHPVEPCALVVRQPPLRPRLHRAEQRRLDGVLAELHAVHAETARQYRNQAPGLVAEVVLRKRGRRVAIGHGLSTPSPGSRRCSWGPC